MESDSRAGIRLLGVRRTDDLSQSASNPRPPWRSGSRARAGGAETGGPARSEQKYEATWVSPFQIEFPFSIPVDRNLAVLLAVDAELRRHPGVSLAEASMHFERRRQVFASTWGVSSTRPAR